MGGIESLRSAIHVLPVPDRWEIDVDETVQGGQPNGIGEIETSDSREWFSEERETHHRARIVVEIVGPWDEGPTEWAGQIQESRAHERDREEGRILRAAEAIRARRNATAD